jgi:hypothetical protein
MDVAILKAAVRRGEDREGLLAPHRVDGALSLLRHGLRRVRRSHIRGKRFTGQKPGGGGEQKPVHSPSPRSSCGRGASTLVQIVKRILIVRSRGVERARRTSWAVICTGPVRSPAFAVGEEPPNHWAALLARFLL